MRQENWEDLEPHIIKDSESRWVREKADLKLDRNGTMSGDFCVTQDITGGKREKETLHQTEKRIRPKLDIIVSSVKETDNLDLADIIDVQAIQSLMDNFYEFAHITIALVDLKGNVLVSIG